MTITSLVISAIGFLISSIALILFLIDKRNDRIRKEGDLLLAKFTTSSSGSPYMMTRQVNPKLYVLYMQHYIKLLEYLPLMIDGEKGEYSRPKKMTFRKDLLLKITPPGTPREMKITIRYYSIKNPANYKELYYFSNSGLSEISKNKLETINLVNPESLYGVGEAEAGLTWRRFATSKKIGGVIIGINPQIREDLNKIVKSVDKENIGGVVYKQSFFKKSNEYIRYFRKNVFKCPYDWIGNNIYIEDDSSSYNPLRRKIIRENIKKIERHGFTCKKPKNAGYTYSQLFDKLQEAADSAINHKKKK